jgi:hypothetical protein
MSCSRGLDTSLTGATAKVHPGPERTAKGLPGGVRRGCGTKHGSGNVARDVIRSESKTLERKEAQEGIDRVLRLTTNHTERIRCWSKTLKAQLLLCEFCRISTNNNAPVLKRGASRWARGAAAAKCHEGNLVVTSLGTWQRGKTPEEQRTPWTLPA